MRAQGMGTAPCGVLFGLVAVFAAGAAPAQEGSASAESPAVELVERWFSLAGELGDDPASHQAFLDLYEEDALHIQGPAGTHQRGTAMFRGREKVALLIARLVEQWTDHTLRLEVSTAAEVSETVIPQAPGPWGGPLVAVEFTLSGTRKDEERRYTVPAAGFFRVRGDRLARVRIYLGMGEAAEVEIQR